MQRRKVAIRYNTSKMWSAPPATANANPKIASVPSATPAKAKASKSTRSFTKNKNAILAVASANSSRKVAAHVMDWVTPLNK